MRKIISLLLTAMLSLGIVVWVSAEDAPGKIHHFAIIAPPTAKVWEAIDITVEARDKDDKVISGYRGSVYFSSETDFGATIPAQGRAVAFKESDNGVLKLSKGVTFKRTGNQKLSVNDLTEDADGSITIRIEENSTSWSGSGNTETITITTPEKWSAITSDSVMVSGKTKKNSKVVLKLNGNEVGTVISDDTGLFTKSLSNISQSTNILTASVLDGNNAVIGATEVQFGTATTGPKYYNTSVLPGLDVEVSTGVTFTIDAEPAMTAVLITLDNSELTTREQSPGKYIASTTAPAKPGNYPVNVKIKNVLGQSTEKNSAVILNVIEKAAPVSTFRNVKATTEWTKANFNFSVDNLPTDVVKFKIAYGDSPDSLSQEATTYELARISQPDGSYNWYVPGLPPKTYSFKIFWVKADGSLSTLASEVLSVTVGGGTCTIGNVGTVEAKTMDSKTILSWGALSGALSYNVYRISAAWDYQLVQNVKDPSYTIYLASGAISYENFAVKALCDGTTESAVPAVANRVQTGPGAIAVLVIVSALASIFFVRRRAY